MGEDSGWDVSDTAPLRLSLGFSWLCLKEFEHVFTATVVNALHKGRISHTFRASAHLIARTHSPEVFSPICSQSLGYEHGRIAQRSLSFRKEMSRVLQPFSALLTMLGTSATEPMARRPAPQLLNHTKAIPYTSPTPPQGGFTFHSSLLQPLDRKTYATALATGVVAALVIKSAYPDQSRQSSPPTICVRVDR